MKTNRISTKYVEWLKPEDMHESSILWLSELRFIKDEQHFFENLIKSFTPQLIDSKNFPKSKKLIDNLKQLEKRNHTIIETIRVHLNKLEIMVNYIDEPKEEEAYKNRHRELIVNISHYLKDYKAFKTQMFDLIKGAIKIKNQKFLTE